MSFDEGKGAVRASIIPLVRHQASSEQITCSSIVEIVGSAA